MKETGEPRKASQFGSRPGDLPAEELIARAKSLREAGWDVHFKFTCAWCGERCTLKEANHLYSQSECFKCGKTTLIDVGGFMLERKG